MIIQKKIWTAAVVEGLFASNSFLSRAFNVDEYMDNGKIVHIPNAGAASGTKKSRTSLPATVTKGTDVDVTFLLGEYTTDLVPVPNADTAEFSYDKRESVLRQGKLRLQDNVTPDFVFDRSPTAVQYIETTGTEIDTCTNKATGKCKGICKTGVLGLMIKLNNGDIPQEGRYLLPNAQMYSQLLNSLVENENTAFLTSAGARNGILGELFSFNVMMRSRVTLYTATKAPKARNAAGATTDLAAGLAWHEQGVCRVLSEVKAFKNEGDATYHGDIYPSPIRAGGRIMREDKKGVIALVQGTPVAEKSYGRIEIFGNPLYRHASRP